MERGNDFDQIMYKIDGVLSLAESIKEDSNNIIDNTYNDKEKLSTLSKYFNIFINPRGDYENMIYSLAKCLPQTLELFRGFNERNIFDYKKEIFNKENAQGFALDVRDILELEKGSIMQIKGYENMFQNLMHRIYHVSESRKEHFDLYDTIANQLHSSEDISPEDFYTYRVAQTDENLNQSAPSLTLANLKLYATFLNSPGLDYIAKQILGEHAYDYREQIISHITRFQRRSSRMQRYPWSIRWDETPNHDQNLPSNS